MKNSNEITRTALLASLIAITGMIKVPTGIPGSEFQLSAPLAIAIVATFGFWRYIFAGTIASLILFLLGLHNILNVEVAFVFRFVVGGLITFLGTSTTVLLIAGPIGTLIARWVLAATLNIDFLTAVLFSIPGMIFTILTVIPFTRLLRRVRNVVWRQYANT